MNNNTHRIAIFLPRPTPFYITLFQGIKKGFEKVGFTVSGQVENLGRDALLKFCRKFKPHTIFEMNRSRAQIPWLPKEIVHIAWIVDLLGNRPEHYRNSEVIYFFEEPLARTYNDLYHVKFHKTPETLVDWLPPRFCAGCIFS